MIDSINQHVNCLDVWLQNNLVCPRDKTPLTATEGGLRCGANHDYPVIEGVPVLLVSDTRQTLHVAGASLSEQTDVTGDPYRISTLGISDAEKAELQTRATTLTDLIDPVASFLVAATNGIAYKHLIGKLDRYPIPSFRLPRGNGEVLIDVGCSWGRWSIAAARDGYSAIGIDPSLGAVLAAKRVATKLGVSARFIVADARFLPFRSHSVGVAFSYSVLQHFSHSDAERAIAEMGRVLRSGGRALVQMPTPFGFRCLYHQARRKFREPHGFEVRYWTIARLLKTFSDMIGSSSVSVDCYFGIGLQVADRQIMPFSRRIAIDCSEMLRRLAAKIPCLVYFADSVYVESTRQAPA